MTTKGKKQASLTKNILIDINIAQTKKTADKAGFTGQNILTITIISQKKLSERITSRQQKA